jgi:pectate lyase
MHMYNNLFRDVRNYVMGPGFNAHFVVQNNLFVAPIHMDRILNTGFNGFNTAVVWSAGNSGVGVLAGGRVSARSVDGVKPWEPGDFYGYTLAADVAGLRDLIPERAGPTLGTIADFLTNLRD